CKLVNWRRMSMRHPKLQPALAVGRVCINYAASTSKIYTLSLHDALPILKAVDATHRFSHGDALVINFLGVADHPRHRAQEIYDRSEEHTSELQSRFDLVCRLLLEKKKYNAQ